MAIEIQNRLFGIIPVQKWTALEPGPVKLLTQEDLQEYVISGKDFFIEAIKFEAGAVSISFRKKGEDGNYESRLISYPPLDFDVLNKVVRKGFISPKFRRNL